MTMEDIIASISECAWNETRLGLDRIRELLRRMGDPQNDLKFIHVAGTNGKGSACAMLASILESAGYKTGLYTSPHLCRLNERFIVNGGEIADETLRELTSLISQSVAQMSEKPTEFEVITAMAMLYFHKMKCDVVVLEVGLGGRLDATNVIRVPEAAVIMNIGLEHTEYLGDTLEKIAREKAGIIKEGGTVVAYRGTPEVEAVVSSVCLERHAALTFARFEDAQVKQQSLDGQIFDWLDLKGLTLRLLGKHQIFNAVTVLETVGVLRKKGWRISDEAVRGGLAAARWPARLEILNRDPLFILDGAHNPQCVEMLASGIAPVLHGEKAVFMTGVLADKAYGQMMKTILPFAKSFVCITPENSRALPAGELAEYLRGLGAKAVACESVENGIASALDAAEDGPVVVFGSLYMAGAVRESFRPVYRNWMRKRGIRKRDQLSAEERKDHSRQIVARIAASPEFQRAKTILLYRAMRGEMSLEELRSLPVAQGKRLVYPLCISKTEMIALYPAGEDAWTVGHYGITEPIPEKSTEIAPEDIDMVLCPCTVFDEKCNRMGMGAGFYDRYLPRCKNARVASVAFEVQKVKEVITDAWDRPMDMVFTESRIYKK